VPQVFNRFIAYRDKEVVGVFVRFRRFSWYTKNGHYLEQQLLRLADFILIWYLQPFHSFDVLPLPNAILYSSGFLLPFIGSRHLPLGLIILYYLQLA
jgi:hypothetical protein